MSNLVPFITRLTDMQQKVVLCALLDAKLDVHVGSMWFMDYDTAVAALHKRLVTIKDSQTTRINGMKYYDPNKNKHALKRCMEVLEIIEGKRT